jgi:hypothetical protein
VVKRQKKNQRFEADLCPCPWGTEMTRTEKVLKTLVFCLLTTWRDWLPENILWYSVAVKATDHTTDILYQYICKNLF